MPFFFGPQTPKICGHLVTWVGEQREVERVLVAKGLVARHAVRADAEDMSPREKLRTGVAELLALDGAARGVILWIEEQDHRFVRQGSQRDLSSFIGREREIGRGLSSCSCGHVVLLSVDHRCVSRSRT
jgi:hypothetical protein